MKIQLTGRIADYESEDKTVFRQYRITGEPVFKGFIPFVEAVLLYDSGMGHRKQHESVRLSLQWLLEACEIGFEEVIPAKIIGGKDREVRVRSNYCTFIFYNADPACNHLIVPKESGGIECRCCNGWYCA